MIKWVDPEIQIISQRLDDKKIVLVSSCAGFGVSRWNCPCKLKKTYQSKGIIKEESDGLLFLEAEKHPLKLCPFIEIDIEKSDIKKLCKLVEFIGQYRIYFEGESLLVSKNPVLENNRTSFKFYNIEFKHFSHLDTNETIPSLKISFPKSLCEHENISKDQSLEARKIWISYLAESINILE